MCNVGCHRFDMIGVILLGDNIDFHFESTIWNGNNSNHIVTLHESNALPFVFVIYCGYDALHLRNWKLDDHLGLGVHGNETKELGVYQLLKAYVVARGPPFAAIGTQHPQATTPFPSRDWYLYSLAMCWVL